jgi:hypothetical protein
MATGDGRKGNTSVAVDLRSPVFILNESAFFKMDDIYFIKQIAFQKRIGVDSDDK